MAVIEICVDSLESALAAQSGGAQRIELCSGLLEGGLTPSLGLIRGVRSRLRIGVHVLIRPRPGDFLYSAEELAIMREDIQLAAEAGADGVVLGVLNQSNRIDVERTRNLVELAGPMQVTFHRAIDMTSDLQVSFLDVLQTGVHRVLTSGGEQTAMLGRHHIRLLVEAGAGKVEVMVGGGVRPENIAEIARITAAQSFHAALRRAPVEAEGEITHGVRLENVSLDVYTRNTVKAEEVRALALAASTGRS